MDDLAIRPLSEIPELRDACALFERVWREQRILTVELLRALATHGNAVLGAFRGGRMVGAQMAFLGRDEGGLILHSHVTAVEPSLQHAGIGAGLKWAQRDWALERGIDRVTWTFDPLIARNAYFNLRKLGARAERFLRNFYGEMQDAFNVGERTDRLEIAWHLRDERVAAAAAGRASPPDAVEAPALLDEEDGSPARRETDGTPLLVRVPSDYLALRRRDARLAAAWRDAVADALEDALARDYAAVDFLREGAYVLERS